MRHPYISIIVTVIISVLPSLFNLEIRTALKKGGRSLRRLALSVAQNRLGVLDSVHGNAYEFILWLCLELRQPLYESSILAFLVFMIWLWGNNLWTIPASIMLGGWIGTLLRIYRVIGCLRTYQISRSKLQRQIASLEATNTVATSQA